MARRRGWRRALRLAGWSLVAIAGIHDFDHVVDSFAEIRPRGPAFAGFGTSAGDGR